jgi:hypothetical protein
MKRINLCLTADEIREASWGYVEGKIYRGVLTGLNKAFVIDEATKDRLDSRRSKECLK